ncbi:MAG TPA: ABC transporter permease [Vicinamibacterales bacterium]|nr:ABC transporter permease [Vicinamibacterales bacterium]
MLKDVQLAVRMLLKQPGFTTIAVLTLALGIGATAAVFSLVDGVLLTPPAYRDPHQLVLIPSVRADSQQVERIDMTPAVQWMDWQQHATSFDAIAAYGWTFNFLVDAEGSVSLEGMVVTHDYFRVVGLQPMVGRAFVAADTAVGATPVIILGYDCWLRRFNGDPHVVGTTIRMSRRDTPPTVVGVMPPGVRFLASPTASQEPNYNENAAVDFWMPGAPNPQRLKQSMWDVIGRLKPGVSPAQGQAELAILARRQAQDDHDLDGRTPRVEPLLSEVNRDGRRILLPLFGAALLVLLIACGNTAALLLVRGLQRHQEFAVRSALGVSRIALFRQAAIESGSLALVGGAAGVALAFAIVRIFKAIAGHAIPRLDAVTAGWPLLACGFGAALAAALLAGLVPAVRASGLDPIHALKGGGPRTSAGRGERRMLRAVTMIQTALTLALLVGAGLLIRTMRNVAAVQSGYSMDRVLTMTVTAVQGDWSDFHQRALESVSRLPGVEQAAFAWGTPLTGNDWPGLVELEGHPVAKPSDRFALPLRAVTPGYFDLLGLPITEGRDFRSTDVRTAPQVAVVNKTLAARYFAGTAVIGKKLWLGGRDRPPTDIVGVVSDARTADLTKAPEPEIYLSLWQATAFSKDLVVRTAGDPRMAAAAIRQALRNVDPTAAVERVQTLEDIRTDSLASRIFARQLLVGFSMVGTLLTVVGVYGVLALSVASRRREIAIRAAIGAHRRDIRNLVFGEGFRLVAGGIVLGIVGALAVSQVLQSFLFQVAPTDPATLIGAGLLFAAVTWVACWVPTRRAVTVDPLEALRCE